jgi:hypothetical protein
MAIGAPRVELMRKTTSWRQNNIEPQALLWYKTRRLAAMSAKQPCF